jgi:hypothetical protein
MHAMRIKSEATLVCSALRRPACNGIRGSGSSHP